MSKVQEFDQRAIASWLSSDLGQTLPEFTTADTAGYGEVRRRFVQVTGRTVVSPTGFLNPQSDRYTRVATFLQADLGQVKDAMEQKQLPRDEASRKQFYENVKALQVKLGEFLNRADAAVRKLQAEKNKITVSKAFRTAAAGKGVDPTSEYVARIKMERERLTKLYSLKDQAFNDYWLSAAPVKYVKTLEQLATDIEGTYNAAQLENTEFALSEFIRAVADQAEKILPTPKDVFKYIPWVVGGIALVAFFPLLRAFSEKGAASVRSPVNGLGRYHW